MKSLIMDKFAFQWRTLKKAFATLNLDKTGSVRPYEMRHILEHWGICLEPDDFEKVFRWFDPTGKGHFSISELQNAVGNTIQPQEGLYFRQDNFIKEPFRKCNIASCSRRPLGFSDLCINHLKEQKQQALQVVLRIYEAIQSKSTGTSTAASTKSRWPRFVQQLIKRSQKFQPTGQNTVVVCVFTDAVLQWAGIKLKDDEVSLLYRAYRSKHQVKDSPALNSSSRKDEKQARAHACLDIYQSLLVIGETQHMMKAYDRLDFTNDYEGTDEIFVDYHGAVQNHKHSMRGGAGPGGPKRKSELVEFKQLADVVGDGILKEAVGVNSTQISRFQQLKDEYLGIDSNLDFFKHFEFLVKELDPTKNGYVTNQELEDIFKLIYPAALQGTNLKKVFKKFASIQNKLLIDHKRLQQAL